MKNNSSSMPPSFYSSKVAEAKEGTINKAALKPQVVEKKKKPTAAAAAKNNHNNNKLESKPSMDINESAELFIKKFRKQLLIQRLESIENYEQMLARGL